MAKESITIPKNDRMVLREIGIRKTQQADDLGSSVAATPDVRRYAEEKGVKLEDITVHREDQNITRQDVDRYLERQRIFEQIRLKHKQRENKQEVESFRPENIFDFEHKTEEDAAEEKAQGEFFDETNDGVFSEPEHNPAAEIKETVESAEEKIELLDEKECAVDVVSDNAALKDEDISDNHDLQIQSEVLISDEEPVENTCEAQDTEIDIVSAIEQLAEKKNNQIQIEAETDDKTEDASFSEPADEDILEAKPQFEETLQNETQDDETMYYDVIVIGCGMSGFETAIYAARSGLKTAVIERDEIGGRTLKDGAFPMAYLRGNTSFIGECGRAAKRGMIINGMSLDLQTMMRDKAKKILRYRDKMAHTLKNFGVDCYHGQAIVNRDRSVSIAFEDEDVQIKLIGKAIVAATGTTSSIPEQYAQISNVFTDGQAHDLERLPDEMVIIGSGISACEYASFYSILGTNVSIITPDDRLLPDFDEDIQKLVEDTFAAMKVDIYYRSEVKDVYRDSLGDLHIEIKEPFATSSVICTDCFVIRKKSPNLQAFELCRPLSGPKGVLVDDNGQTTCGGIYAVGHVVGNGAKGASPSQIIATIMGEKDIQRPEFSPICINAFPQIAVIGLSERDAKATGRKVIVKKIASDKNMRLFIDDRIQGFVKLIGDADTGKLLGAAICCENAFELVSFVQMAMSMSGTIDDCASVFFCHPSAASILGEAALLI